MDTNTIFPEYVELGYFKEAIGSLERKVNGIDNAVAQRPLYYKQWLTPKFSPDFKYNEAYLDGARVKADFVSMDSPLPLKKRGSLGSTFGVIPKQGTARKLNETQVANIQSMEFHGAEKAQIAAELYDDLKACVEGIYDNNEFAFLKLFSEGQFAATDADNTGALIRVDAGYLDKNKFTASINWGSAGYKPVTDCKRVRKQAKGVKPRYAIMAEETYDLIRLSDEAKQIAAIFGGVAYTQVSQLITPNDDVFRAAFRAETKLEIIVVETDPIVSQKNGEDTDLDPFAKNVVVFTDTLQMGNMYYTPVPESRRNNTAKLMETAIVDTYIFAKKWGSTNPLTEWTAAEAFCFPVITAVQNKYHLQTDGATDDEQTEGNTTIEIDGVEYNRTDAITSLLNFGKPANEDNSDAELLAMYNSLSNANKIKFKAGFPVVDPTSLEFTNAADSTGKVIAVSGLSGTVTASSSAGFATATVSGTNVTVTVTANSGAARTAKVTITRGGKASTITVSQAGA